MRGAGAQPSQCKGLDRSGSIVGEAERYLAAISAFRAEGCEPHWRLGARRIEAGAAPPAGEGTAIRSGSNTEEDAMNARRSKTERNTGKRGQVAAGHVGCWARSPDRARGGVRESALE